MNFRDLITEERPTQVGVIPVQVPTPTLELRRRAAGADQREAAAVLPEPPGDPYLFPDNGNYTFTEKVLPCAVAKVDAICDQALALGWTKARLYQNRGRLRFPFGGDYGLVCFISGDKRIGEVATQHIEILVGSPPRESRMRFYNADALVIKERDPGNYGRNWSSC